MSGNTCNGWTNYETWRVNLEVFDGFDPSDSFDVKPEAEELAAYLESLADGLVLEPVPEGLARDLAAHMLSRVDWAEIAENMLADYWTDEGAQS